MPNNAFEPNFLMYVKARLVEQAQEEPENVTIFEVSKNPVHRLVQQALVDAVEKRAPAQTFTVLEYSRSSPIAMAFDQHRFAGTLRELIKAAVPNYTLIFGDYIQVNTLDYYNPDTVTITFHFNIYLFQ